MEMDAGFAMRFGLMQAMFYIVPVLMLAIIGMSIFRWLKEWNHNENSPRLTVDAKVVSKRSEIRRTMSHAQNVHHHSRTNYYVTFEVESGDRMELELQGHEYGLLVEGDKGKLIFQGTRFLGFERTV